MEDSASQNPGSNDTVILEKYPSRNADSDDVIILEETASKNQDSDDVIILEEPAPKKRRESSPSPPPALRCRTVSEIEKEEPRKEKELLESIFLHACAPIVKQIAKRARGSLCDGCLYSMGNQQGHYDVRTNLLS